MVLEAFLADEGCAGTYAWFLLMKAAQEPMHGSRSFSC